ncbi:DNA-dependent RNA polymerase auxiliary subunit epsilon family protein [Jeotgalibaca sp. MA1X17-3]|uniref:DNA-directed RNA polymerase subunit epsilon n=1 Tax=Jeotgalibaca sp. MA1X17-3 TaxID=2908211 RepID=UPI001F2A414C|nr:DNA-directed RNA polymerase subunit epsilon [Jeotgalibaca sp. MA1X17-3]UJF15016.1 DNA-dependent RNA polymerase auxiliary subunit epsilon family protein [Jeotgalibaca sp. MA1X17-3]
MLFKVTYQPNLFDVPTRETTLSLYMEAESEVDARKILEDNTPYNIEFVQPIEGKHLEYEKNNPEFQLTEFS